MQAHSARHSSPQVGDRRPQHRLVFNRREGGGAGGGGSLLLRRSLAPRLQLTVTSHRPVAFFLQDERLADGESALARGF
jgi:hypothetical protein